MESAVERSRASLGGTVLETSGSARTIRCWPGEGAGTNGLAQLQPGRRSLWGAVSMGRDPCPVKVVASPSVSWRRTRDGAVEESKVSHDIVRQEVPGQRRPQDVRCPCIAGKTGVRPKSEVQL